MMGQSGMCLLWLELKTVIIQHKHNARQSKESILLGHKVWPCNIGWGHLFCLFYAKPQTSRSLPCPFVTDETRKHVCVCSQSIHMTAVWPVHLRWFAIWNPKQKRKLFSSLQHSFWSFLSTQQLIFRKYTRSYELWSDCEFWLKLGNGFKNYWGHGRREDTGRHMDMLADRWMDRQCGLPRKPG